VIPVSGSHTAPPAQMSFQSSALRPPDDGEGDGGGDGVPSCSVLAAGGRDGGGVLGATGRGVVGATGRGAGWGRAGTLRLAAGAGINGSLALRVRCVVSLGTDAGACLASGRGPRP
jgi:hypothetical protein